MISVEEIAVDCNAIPAAKADNVSSAIPQQANDKVHCFCLELAKTEGEEAAVILQGLGYKVAKSKKEHDGRKWHYDPLRVLEQRWPYLTDSGIHGIIERQVAKGNVFTGRYNQQWWRDRTTWYSVTHELQQRALSDEGKIWFDVPAAVKCKSIMAGTLYHNLRYQLLLFLADTPKFSGVPYHRVNKTALSRVLPWSLSTIQRGFLLLEKHGFVEENPLRVGEYTILLPADLVVPESMTRSSVEMGTKSSTEMTKSHTEKTRSSTEMTKSCTDDITHYKTIEKAIHKHHSLTATPIVLGECVDADAAKASGHYDISASTVPVEATCSHQQIRSLAHLRERISILTKLVPAAEQKIVAQQVPDLTHSLIVADLPFDALRAGWLAKTPEEIIPALLPIFQSEFGEHGTNVGWSPEACEMAVLQAVDFATEAFLVRTQGWKAVAPMFNGRLPDAVWNASHDIPLLGDHPEATPEDKTHSIMLEIRRSNEHGWPTYGDEDLEYKVPANASTRTAALDFFVQNPEVTTHDAWRTISDCVEVHQRNTAPKEGFDPLWKSRRGIKPPFLFKYWDDIQAEIDSAEILSN
jgi:hypothetical protein